METNKYGSIEFYESMFADILADVGSGTPAEDDITSINILIGFERAIESWLEYHNQAASSYQKLLQSFTKAKTDV